MRTPTGNHVVATMLFLMIWMLLFSTACTPNDPATWMLVTPEATQAHPATELSGMNCERNATLARLRDAIPYEQAVLYYTGRPNTDGSVVYGLTLWYVDPNIPLQTDEGDVESTISDVVNRSAPFLREFLADDVCVSELYDIFLLSVVDAAYNSWYLGNIAITDIMADSGSETLLNSPDILLRETWPETSGELSPGTCTWKEATQQTSACDQSNGGCLLTVTEQMGSLAVMQSVLPISREDWRADRDKDMAMANEAVAGLACFHPRPYSMVMNFVNAEGDLLFAGEWSGTASQVTYYASADPGG